MQSFSTKNPNFKEDILKKLEGQHFMHHMKFNLSSIEEGKVIGQMPLLQIHNQQFGFVHGGVTSTVLDIVMGFAAFSLAPAHQGVVTANLNVDFMRPGQGDTLVAKGWVVKPGKNMFFCKGEVYVLQDNKETLIASSSSVMAVIDVL